MGVVTQGTPLPLEGQLESDLNMRVNDLGPSLARATWWS